MYLWVHVVFAAIGPDRDPRACQAEDVRAQVFPLLVVGDDPQGRAPVVRPEDRLGDPVVGDREHADVRARLDPVQDPDDPAGAVILRAEIGFRIDGGRRVRSRREGPVGGLQPFQQGGGLRGPDLAGDDLEGAMPPAIALGFIERLGDRLERLPLSARDAAIFQGPEQCLVDLGVGHGGVLRGS
jgi:hypothetical protein